jgi:hypothetical protein
MRNKMLRSVLVAAFSAAVALGVLAGSSDAKDEIRANTVWPSVAVNSNGVTSEAGSVTQEAGS